MSLAGPGAARPHVPLWLIGLLTFSGTLAMHIFVPALPSAAADLGVGTSTMQATIGLYIVGLAVGQLIYGPVSDRFGRRPVLMAALVLYTVSGMAAALAPDAQFLIAARLFQALGGCAGLVLGRAIVRDTSSPEDATRRLALTNLMVTLGPGVAPLIGGALVEVTGWRSIFVALCLLGVSNFMLAWRRLPETAVLTSVSGRVVARNYCGLLKSPAFLGFALGGGCATTSMYAYVAAAPFIFTRELGRPAFEVGIYLAILILGIWLGNALASRLIGRISAARMMFLGNGLSAACSFLLLAVVLTGQLSVVAVVGLMFLFTLGMGVASPAAMACAISVNPAVAGSASGLYGFTQMGIGALCTALVGIWSSPSLSTAVVLSVAGIVSQLSFLIANRTGDAA